MSGKRVICRTCDNEYPLEAENCPNCGTKIRGWKAPTAAVVVGATITIGSLLDIGSLWVFFLVGVVLTWAGVQFLRERRNSIVEAE